MRQKKPRHKRRPLKGRIELLCGQVGPEDGIDPRTIRRESHTNRAARKTLQLCKQVERALSLAFAGELDDPLLRDLQVLSVEPAPNSARMLVIVSCDTPADSIKPQAVADHLMRAAGRLRCEVAGAIHRKKTPELTFCVVPFRAAQFEMR